MKRFNLMLLVVAVIAVLGFNQKVEAKAEQVMEAIPYPSGTVNLAIVGYNYTRRYIADFSVDGNGGGNIMVSTPSSGGGGTSCCEPYLPGLTDYKVKVRWQADACMFHTYSQGSKETNDNIHSFYKEIEVPVIEDFSTAPKYMEVHFYPDGKVAVTVTDSESSPRLRLSDSRQDTSKFPRCPGDKKPKTQKVS